MFKIAGSRGLSRTSVGGKALNLIRLDRAGLTADFAIVPCSVFREFVNSNPGVKKHIRENYPDIAFGRANELFGMASVNEDIIDEIWEMAKKWKNGFIARSSFAQEDSARRSFSGMFSSFRGKSRKDLESCIKKVWLSVFSPAVIKYGRLRNFSPRMSVVIQEFLKPEYSGVCFTGRDSAYIEFSAGCGSVVSGRVRPDIFISKGDTVYCGGASASENQNWLSIVSGKAREFASVAEDGPDLDFEFVFSGGGIKFVQYRPLTARPDLGGVPVIFEWVQDYPHHPSEFSNKAANGIIGKSGLSAKIRAFESGGRVCVPFSFFLEIEKELGEKAGKPAFLGKFRKNYLGFLASEMKKAAETTGKGREAALANFKKFNFKTSVYEMINEKILESMRSHFKDRLGAEAWKRNIGFFLPEKSFLLEHHAKVLSEETGALSFYDRKIVDKIRKNIGRVSSCRAGKKRMRVPRSALPPGLMNLAAEFRKNLSLKERVNVYYASVSLIYARILASEKTKGGINEMLRLPFAEALEALKNGKGFRRRGIAGEMRIKTDFPLAGLVAQKGKARGTVRVVRNFADAAKVGRGDILVAKYTEPRLFMGMLACSGIITEEGGLTSHAAIISRELKKPCIVGVAGCTSMLREGEKIEIRNGKIYRL